MTIESLDKRRSLRGKQSRLMWRVLNRVFDQLGIAGSMRHELMFMDQGTYLAWGRDERIVPLEKLELAIKYAQLWRALHSMCGDDETVIRHWFHTNNNGYPTLFKGRSPIDTILEDGERVIEGIIATLRIR